MDLVLLSVRLKQSVNVTLTGLASHVKLPVEAFVQAAMVCTHMDAIQTSML